MDNETYYTSIGYKELNENAARAVRELIVGDIVLGWLDAPLNPLPLIILEPPKGDVFLAKYIFGDEFHVRFGYPWKKVGHINGLD